MTFLGVDNGVSGSCGIINSRGAFYLPMPIRKCLNYTKSKQFLNRIDGMKFMDILIRYEVLAKDSICFIERPMINPGRFRATISAIRAMEATLIVLEMMQVPYQWVDSKEWQRVLLPKGLEKDELKLASLEVGKRLFPSIEWKGFKDADGLLLAEHARRIKSA